MAEQTPIRVLWQMTLGVPYVTASDQDKQAALEQLTAVVKAWKANGVKIIGGFSGFGVTPSGFVHTIILEVSSLEQLAKMNQDIFREPEKYMEKSSFCVGQRGWVEAI